MSLPSPQRKSSVNDVKSSSEVAHHEKSETPKKKHSKETPQTPTSMKVIIRTIV